MLEHLGVGDAHTHRAGRLFDRARLEEPELEDAPVALGQSSKYLTDLVTSGDVGGLGRVAKGFNVERRPTLSRLAASQSA
jgi:hypothetical protein